MQRNVMEYRHDFRLFQEINQRAAIGDIPQFDVKHVGIMPAVFRNRRQLDTPGARQRR